MWGGGRKTQMAHSGLGYLGESLPWPLGAMGAPQAGRCAPRLGRVSAKEEQWGRGQGSGGRGAEGGRPAKWLRQQSRDEGV